MKQFAFMVLVTAFGMAGSFVFAPVYGFAVYYMYSVVRPEVMWEWSLPPDGGWSFKVAAATLVAVAVWRLGLFSPLQVGQTPWYGNPKFTRTHALFLGFAFWISLTYPTAFRPDVALPYFQEYLKIFVMFAAATFALRTVGDLWIIYYVVAGSVVFVAYEVNFEYFVNHYLVLNSRALGGLDNNGAALMLGMAVPMCFFVWEGLAAPVRSAFWESVRVPLRWGFLGAVPVLIHAVLLSFSRGAMISVIAAGAWIFIRSRHKRVLFVLYGLAFVFIVATAGKEVQARFMSISKADADESMQSRTTTWKIAIRMATEQPLFGFGIRNSNLYTRRYGADIEGRSIHSQYLQTAADSGFVALALYLGFIGSAVAGLWRVRRILRPWNDPETERTRALASGVECGLVCFVVGAFLLSLEHFEMPYILLLLATQLHAIARTVEAKLGLPVPNATAGARPAYPVPAAVPS